MKIPVFILALFHLFHFFALPEIVTDDPSAAFPDLKNWEKSVETREYMPDNLFDYINGAADSYLSYQFKHLWVKEYTVSSGVSIKAEIYEHSDENNAFGIYSIERAPEYNFQKIGSQAYRYEDILNMVCGNFYVKLHGYNLPETSWPDLEALARGIAENLDPDAGLPETLEKFPPEDLVLNSEMYVNENFLGYDFLKHAFASVYSKDDQTFQLFMIKGEDRIDCENMLKSYLKFASQDPEMAKEGHIVIHDRYNGDVNVLWKNDLILGTVECTDEDMCQGYLDKFETNLNN